MDCDKDCINKCDDEHVVMVGIPAPITTLEDVNIINPTIVGGTMDGTAITNVTIGNSTIDNSIITDSTFEDGTINDSDINNPTITDGTWSNPTITGGTLNNATILFDGEPFYQRWVVGGYIRAEVLDINTNVVIPAATLDIASWARITKIGNVVNISITLLNALPSNQYWWSTEVAGGTKWWLRLGTVYRMYPRRYSWVPVNFPVEAIPNTLDVNENPVNTAGLTYQSVKIPVPIIADSGASEMYAWLPTIVHSPCQLAARMEGSDVVFRSMFNYTLGIYEPFFEDIFYNENPSFLVNKRIDINYHTSKP